MTIFHRFNAQIYFSLRSNYPSQNRAFQSSLLSILFYQSCSRTVCFSTPWPPKSTDRCPNPGQLVQMPPKHPGGQTEEVLTRKMESEHNWILAELPSYSALGRHIWSAGTNAGHPSTRDMDILERDQQDGPLRQLKAWSIWHMRRGWESWDCLAWGKQALGTSYHSA